MDIDVRYEVLNIGHYGIELHCTDIFFDDPKRYCYAFRPNLHCLLLCKFLTPFDKSIFVAKCHFFKAFARGAALVFDFSNLSF